MNAYVIASIITVVILIAGIVSGGVFFNQFYNCKTNETKVYNEHHCPSELDSIFGEQRFLYPRDKQLRVLRILQKVLRVFRRHNVVHWSIGGTLLGQMRNGGIIPWDDDVDLGVLDLEEIKQINWSAEGLRIKAHKKIKNLLQIFNEDETAYVDIFRFSVREDGTYMIDNAHFKDTIQSLFPLKYASFHDMTVPIPQGTGAYLEHKFGQNWDNEYFIRWTHLIEPYCKKFFKRNSITRTPEIHAAILKETQKTTQLIATSSPYTVQTFCKY